MIGQTFNRLTVIAQKGRDSRNKKTYLCVCRCGSKVVADAYSLKGGNTKSCGCLLRDVLVKRNKENKTHGMSLTPEYTSYRSAKDRCKNKNCKDYLRYGGRGIQFKFSSFEELYKEVGSKPSSEHTLDRINNDGHYEKGNVRWATPEEQSNNRTRSVDLENYKLLEEYAEAVMSAHQ